MIEKKTLVEAIAKKINIGQEQAETIVNETIAELVSPVFFGKPGERVGFINDNHCTNNCKDQIAVRQAK
jgi:nucleoid DNA-binding protein